MESILKRQHKRGQAAMEFLMTYGWAILAAIIAIGVLAYFGVFNPGRLAGSQGIINAPFNMDAFVIEDEGAAATCNAAAGFDCIRMEITQNLGETMTNANLALTVISKQGWDSTTTPITCTSDLGVLDWVSGDSVTWTCAVAAAGTEAWGNGVSTSSDLTLTYRTSGSSLDQTATGSVRGVSS